MNGTTEQFIEILYEAVGDKATALVLRLETLHQPTPAQELLALLLQPFGWFCGGDEDSLVYREDPRLRADSRYESYRQSIGAGLPLTVLLLFMLLLWVAYLCCLMPSLTVFIGVGAFLVVGHHLFVSHRRKRALQDLVAEVVEYAPADEPQEGTIGANRYLDFSGRVGVTDGRSARHELFIRGLFAEEESGVLTCRAACAGLSDCRERLDTMVTACEAPVEARAYEGLVGRWELPPRKGPSRVIRGALGCLALAGLLLALIATFTLELPQSAPQTVETTTSSGLRPLTTMPAEGQRVLAQFRDGAYGFPGTVDTVSAMGACIVAYADGMEEERRLEHLFHDDLGPGSSIEVLSRTSSGKEGWFKGHVEARRPDGLQVLIAGRERLVVPLAQVRVSLQGAAR